jgi:hypothetical protein
MKLEDRHLAERIVLGWARTIIRIPNECQNAKSISKKDFLEIIGETPEEYLKAL